MKKVIALFESIENLFSFCWQAFKLLMDLNYLFVITLYEIACYIVNFASKIHELPMYAYYTAIDFSKEAYLFLVEIFVGFSGNFEKTFNIFIKLTIVHEFGELSNDLKTLFKANLKMLPVIIIAAAACHLVYEIYSYLEIRFERMREIMNDLMEQERLRNEFQVEPRTRHIRQRRRRQVNPEPRESETQQSEEPHTSREEGESVSPSKRSYLCCVCMENNCEIVLMPCKHLCICDSCFRKSRAQTAMRMCPICRQLVKKEIKIFA